MKKILCFALVIGEIACNSSSKSGEALAYVKESVNSESTVAIANAGITLPFRIVKQPELHLCWAAVAESISTFYDASSPYRLCDIANMAFNYNSCCDDIKPCDSSWFLGQALSKTQNLKQLKQGMPSFDILKNEIVNGYVVALRVAWRGTKCSSGGDLCGHFIVIHGFHDDGSLDVADPWPESNPGRKSLAEVELYYKNTGQITHYYLTKKSSQ